MPMNFLRRHKYGLLFLAVVALSCVLALRQYERNQAEHVRLREDFILLHLREQTAPAEHLYQKLVKSLPRLPDQRLIDDHQRLVIVNLEHDQPPGSLLLKYKGAVQRVLNQRTDRRLQRLLQNPSLPE